MHWVVIEILSFLVLGVGQAFLFSDLLGSHFTVTHDAFLWPVPIYHLFSSALWNGEFPLWDPYSHGGQPFYPLLAQMRFLEPYHLLQALLFKGTADPLLAFNWNRYGLSLITIVGIYLCLRHVTKSLVARIAVQPILLFSPVFWGQFYQDGFINQFVWMPYLVLLFYRVWERKKLDRLSAAAAGMLIGWSCQSYFFAGPLILLLFISVGLALFYRRDFRDILLQKDVTSHLLLGAGVCALVALPDLALWIDQKQFVFPLRASTNWEGIDFSTLRMKLENSSLIHSYSALMQNGARSHEWDLFHMLTGDGTITFNVFNETPPAIWGIGGTEAYLYIGMAAFCVSLFGMFYGQPGLRKLWGFLTPLYFLLMLGIRGKVHHLLYLTFPPAWFIRNTHCFVLYFDFFLLHLFVTGVDAIWAKRRDPIRRPRAPIWLIVAYGCLIGGLLSVLPLVKYPYDSLYGVPLLVGVGVGYFLKNKLRKEGFWLSITLGFLLSVLVACLVNSPGRVPVLLTRWLIFILLPVIAWLAGKKRRPWDLIAAGVFVALLCFDVFSVAEKSRQTWLRPVAFPKFEAFQTAPPRPRLVSPSDDKSFMQNFYSATRSKYVSAISKVPSVFPMPLVDTPPFPTAEASLAWNRTHPLNNIFFFYRSYVDLLTSDVSNEQLLRLFRIGQSPWQCLAISPAETPREVSREEILNAKIVNCQIELHSGSLNRLSLKVESSEPSLLFFSDAYDPHWKARLNGLASPVLRAATLFKAVALPKGTTRVDLAFEPTFLVGSLVISLSTSAMVLLAMAIFSLKRRRSVAE